MFCFLVFARVSNNVRLARHDASVRYLPTIWFKLPPKEVPEPPVICFYSVIFA